ncbi:uncharacterized protein [Choristoneura fumiferana]|uniref:uncharacterized protein n=1 Tax=Choristoneura fumiferana TaxID=7141 RepID=UPI003D15CDDC
MDFAFYVTKMDKQEVKRSSKTRLWLSARRKKKGPARHKKENINPNSTLGTGEHASEQSDSDNNTDPPPQPLNLSSTLGTGEHMPVSSLIVITIPILRLNFKILAAVAYVRVVAFPN